MSGETAAPIVGRDHQPAAGIGAPIPRHDGRAKVTGEARYAGEEIPPGTLHAVVVASSIARGRLTGLDAQSALAVPGVVTVLTHREMPKLGPATVLPFGQTQLPMQSPEIHYEGEPLALVLAETLEAAVEGAARLRPTYEPLQPVTFEDGREVVPRSASEGNAAFAIMDIDAQRGEVGAAFENAAAVIDQIYRTPCRHHNTMEPSATLAEWRGDTLEVHDATQWTYGVRYGLSAVFGIPPEKVHVRCPYTGGGFGAKGTVWSHQFLAALGAKISGRPVKLALTRAACFTGCGYQPMMRSHVRLAADRDGVLRAVVHETANLTSQSDDYVEFGNAGARGLYATPALLVRTRIVRADVNTPTAMRAPHEGPGMFALEGAMDELAVALDIDPLELRLRNYAESDPMDGKPFSSKKLREAYTEAARRFGWSGRPRAPRSMRDGHKLLGWGMASAIMGTNRIAANARVRFAVDGAVTVEAGCQEIGNGAATVLPQIAAEVLGIPIERITLRRGDTGLPETGGTFGSSTTMCVGSAVADAAEKLKARIAALAAANGANGASGANGTDAAIPPERWGAILGELGVAEVVAEGAFAPVGSPWDLNGGQSGYAMLSWGAVFVEMEVDEALGLARMRRCVAGYSVGRVINPRTARSQMIGGIVWGYGRAMLEESVIDRRYGRFLSKNLSGVMLPVNADIPRDIDVFFVDEHDQHASKIGARGVGEVGEVGVAAAIANALYHATGTRIRRLPVHVEDLLA
jgi:xanthine dehydrogenase YagR molybdenum-binding subunit